MDRFLIDELRARCIEISTGETDLVMISKTVDAYERILEFAVIARKEGLLELEEAAALLDVQDETQELFIMLTGLIVDGTEPGMVRQIGANMCASRRYSSYVGLMNLMYIQGALMIQAGKNKNVIANILKSMMPTVVVEELFRRECDRALPKALEESLEQENLISSLCKHKGEIDEKDHSVLNETAKTIIMLSDQDMQRLLRDIDNNTVALAMKGLPGQARERFFNNMSKNISRIVAEDMEYMGPVRLRDVEECCVSIMKTLLSLSNKWEIQEYDLSILKVVLDMYDSAEQENEALKDKYQELRTIINNIYNE